MTTPTPMKSSGTPYVSPAGTDRIVPCRTSRVIRYRARWRGIRAGSVMSISAFKHGTVIRHPTEGGRFSVPQKQAFNIPHTTRQKNSNNNSNRNRNSNSNLLNVEIGT